VLEVQHEVHADLGVRLMESIEHLEKRAIEALRVERHLLGADADGLDPGSASAASHAASFELLSTIGSPPESRISRSFSRPLGVTPTVGLDGGVVLMNVRDDLGDLRESLLLATVPSWRSISLRAISSSR
jgi:hypothetical protein